jgi:hypothetical protein
MDTLRCCLFGRVLQNFPNFAFLDASVEHKKGLGGQQYLRILDAIANVSQQMENKNYF